MVAKIKADYEKSFCDDSFSCCSTNEAGMFNNGGDKRWKGIG